MIRLLAVAALAFALALAGCGKSVDPGIQSPAGLSALYEAQGLYASTQRIALEYVRLRQCRKSEQVSITNLCARRAVKVMIGEADKTAVAALGALEAAVNVDPASPHTSLSVAAKAAIDGLRSILTQYAGK